MSDPDTYLSDLRSRIFPSGVASGDLAVFNGNAWVRRSAADFVADAGLQPQETLATKTISLDAGQAWSTWVSWPITTLVTASGTVRSMSFEIAVEDDFTNTKELVTMRASLSRNDSLGVNRLSNYDNGLVSTSSVAWSHNLMAAAAVDLAYDTFETRLSISGGDVLLEVRAHATGLRLATGDLWLGRAK